MAIITPRNFIADYMDPAIQLWRAHPSEAHLAIHAISQADILCEVLLNNLKSVARIPLDEKPAAFRNKVAAREPSLGVVRDIHDGHKHGSLDRPTALIKLGPRPTITSGSAFFAGHSFVGDVLGETELSIRDDGGQIVSVESILRNAEAAWARELNMWGY